MKRRARWLPWLVASAAIVAMAMPSTPDAGAADPVPGSQGRETSLPLTESAVTVSGRDRFASLQVAVNQTKNLANQAVSITWKGATPTQSSSTSRFGAHFLQIYQCWGDDDGTNAANPGPPPEQCQVGAVAGSPNFRGGQGYPAGGAMSRVIGAKFWPDFTPQAGTVLASNGRYWLPFRAVNGESVVIQQEPSYDPSNPKGDFWLNSFFNIITTNEVPAAYTFLDGTGAELLQMNTGLQSSGLGCGQRVQPLGDAKKVPQCWIVVVPRGDAAIENAGTEDADGAAQIGVSTSPLSAAAWANRIAIPVEFNPVDSLCSLAQIERRIAGSEVPQTAISSWQPALCTTGGLPPYSYSVVGDPSARQQLTAPRPGAPGMVVVSQPLSEGQRDAASPALYAPITVSGIVIGANVERNYTDATPDARPLIGTRVANIDLTPRLVAKLLTQSYRGQVEVADASPFYTQSGSRTGVPYAWDDANPINLATDPDFLQFNPEFALITADRRIFGGLQLPSGNSDAAQMVWEWILADPEAKAWLDGTPDPWGMRVNLAYSTNADINLSGAAFGSPAPNSFPKSDPYCYQAPGQGNPNDPSKLITPPPLCGLDWMPYNRGLLDGARIARQAADGAKILQNAYAPSANDVWRRSTPQFLGGRSMLSITDTSAASRFGLQMVRLSRAGDGGAQRTFIAPDSTGLARGVDAMTARSTENFLEPNHQAATAGAYPLTTIAYAAVKPLSLDAAGRSDYAAFLDYAAGPGQVPGVQYGQLPVGYLPLPDSFQVVTKRVAEQVRTMTAAPTEGATTTTSTTPAASPTTVPTVEQQPPSGPAVQTGSSGTGSVGGSGSTPRPSSSSGTRPASSSGSAGSPPSDSTTTTVPAETTDTSTSGPSVTDAGDDNGTDATGGEISGGVPPTTAPPSLTPTSDRSWTRFGVVGVTILALGSALGALEITKRKRKVPTSTIAMIEQLNAA